MVKVVSGYKPQRIEKLNFPNKELRTIKLSEMKAWLSIVDPKCTEISGLPVLNIK